MLSLLKEMSGAALKDQLLWYLLSPGTATTQIHWLFQNQGIPPLNSGTQFPWTVFLSFELHSTVGEFFLSRDWIPAGEELFPNNIIVSKKLYLHNIQMCTGQVLMCYRWFPGGS